MNLLNLFDIVDAVAAQKQSEQPTDNVVDVPATVQASQANGQPATIVVPVAAASEVEVLEDNHEDSLNIGDEVIIAGNVQYQGKTGRVVDFGRNKHFVVVDLYNFGKHSFHSSNVEHNDYADSEEEDADWRERDHGLFGDDERDEDLTEGFGAYYYEQLAQKMFDLNPDFSTKGRCDELLNAAFPIAVQDLGKKRAQWEFGYDEDFVSDFVSAYGHLQRGGELDEGWKQNLAALGTAAALGATGMAAMGGNTPTTGGPELANPNQIVQMIKAGKISDSHDLQAVLAKAKNKNQVWSVLQNAAGMQGSSDADAVVQTIAGVREGVAEGEYDDPRWEPREPDMSRKVDWDIEAQRNAPEEPEAAKTVTVTDNNDKVVLTFPSTGGFYGDLRYATSKGFDTDSGDYHLSWKRDTNEEFDRIKKLAGLK